MIKAGLLILCAVLKSNRAVEEKKAVRSDKKRRKFDLKKKRKAVGFHSFFDQAKMHKIRGRHSITVGLMTV